MMRTAAMLVLLSALCACASRPPAASGDGHPEDAVPGDLAISVTVHSEYTDPELIARLERWRRPARYIVEPDWLLRAGAGAGVTEGYFPAGIRQLDREQMHRLWRSITQSGLLREDHPRAVESEQTATPPSIGTTAIIAISRGGQTRARRISLDGGADDAQAVAGLVDQLAALAWIRE